MKEPLLRVRGRPREALDTKQTNRSASSNCRHSGGWKRGYRGCRRDEKTSTISMRPFHGFEYGSRFTTVTAACVHDPHGCCVRCFFGPLSTLAADPILKEKKTPATQWLTTLPVFTSRSLHVFCTAQRGPLLPLSIFGLPSFNFIL